MASGRDHHGQGYEDGDAGKGQQGGALGIGRGAEDDGDQGEQCKGAGHRVHRLPAQSGQQGHQGGACIAPDAENGPGQGQRGGAAPSAGYGDDADQGEGSEGSDGRGEHGLPEVEALGNQGSSQRDPQNRDVGGEPDPEELAGRPVPLVLGHGLDAPLLHPGEDGALFWRS